MGQKFGMKVFVRVSYWSRYINLIPSFVLNRLLLQIDDL